MLATPTEAACSDYPHDSLHIDPLSVKQYLEGKGYRQLTSKDDGLYFDRIVCVPDEIMGNQISIHGKKFPSPHLILITHVTVHNVGNVLIQEFKGNKRGIYVYFHLNGDRMKIISCNDGDGKKVFRRVHPYIRMNILSRIEFFTIGMQSLYVKDKKNTD